MRKKLLRKHVLGKKNFLRNKKQTRMDLTLRFQLLKFDTSFKALPKFHFLNKSFPDAPQSDGKKKKIINTMQVVKIGKGSLRK